MAQMYALTEDVRLSILRSHVYTRAVQLFFNGAQKFVTSIRMKA